MTWRRVEVRARCTECGGLVAVVWRWFATPLKYTHDLCEPCVERLLKEKT